MHLHRITLPTFITKVNIRIRFLYFCSLLLLVLISKNPVFLGLIFLFHLGFLINKKNEVREIFHVYAEPIFVASLLVLIKSLDLSSFHNTIVALKENLFLGVRILSAFTLFLFFYGSLSFFEIIKLMKWLRVPSLFTELFFLSFKFISLLKEDMTLIYLSQKNRLGFWGFRRSLTSLKYLVSTSFFKALRHSQTVLQSMEQRGFDFKNLPFNLEPFRPVDLFYFSLVLLLWILLWINL